jgi:serine/threonine protein kinase
MKKIIIHYALILAMLLWVWVEGAQAGGNKSKPILPVPDKPCEVGPIDPVPISKPQAKEDVGNINAIAEHAKKAHGNKSKCRIGELDINERLQYKAEGQNCIVPANEGVSQRPDVEGELLAYLKGKIVPAGRITIGRKKGAQCMNQDFYRGLLTSLKEVRANGMIHYTPEELYLLLENVNKNRTKWIVEAEKEAAKAKDGYVAKILKEVSMTSKDGSKTMATFEVGSDGTITISYKDKGLATGLYGEALSRLSFKEDSKGNYLEVMVTVNAGKMESLDRLFPDEAFDQNQERKKAEFASKFIQNKEREKKTKNGEDSRNSKDLDVEKEGSESKLNTDAVNRTNLVKYEALYDESQSLSGHLQEEAKNYDYINKRVSNKERAKFIPAKTYRIKKAGVEGIQMVQPPSTADLRDISHFATEQKMGIALQLAGGVEELHRIGVMHGDLSRENTRYSVKPDGSIQLGFTAFGSAFTKERLEAGYLETYAVREKGKIIGREPQEFSVVHGTLAYRAPESMALNQKRKNDETRDYFVSKNLKRDVYSFGIYLNSLLRNEEGMETEASLSESLENPLGMCEKLRHDSNFRNSYYLSKQTSTSHDEKIHYSESKNSEDVAKKQKGYKQSLSAIVYCYTEGAAVLYREKYNALPAELKDPRDSQKDSLERLIVDCIQPDPNKRIDSTEARKRLEKLMQ